jgi:hypothetical protein
MRLRSYVTHLQTLFCVVFLVIIWSWLVTQLLYLFNLRYSE